MVNFVVDVESLFWFCVEKLDASVFKACVVNFVVVVLSFNL